MDEEQFVNEAPEAKWIYCLTIGIDGYIVSLGYQPEISIEESSEDEPLDDYIVLDSIDDYDFSGERLHAYRWDSETETLIFDSARYAELMVQQNKEHIQSQIMELTQTLRQTDSVILEALEELLSATTLTGFLSTLINAAKNVHETIIARADIREQIEKLKEDVTLK